MSGQVGGATFHEAVGNLAIACTEVKNLRGSFEIVSSGNKRSFHALYALIEKALELLERRIHLLLIDPFPPGPRDPEGIHAAIWEEIGGEPFKLPESQRLTLASYECNSVTRAFVEAIAVGDRLPDLPLFLEPDGYIEVPLESTYTAAYNVMPRRWRDVLETE